MTTIASSGSALPIASTSIPSVPSGAPNPTTSSAASQTTTQSAAEQEQPAQESTDDLLKKIDEMFARMVGDNFNQMMGKQQEAFDKAEQARQKEGRELANRFSEMGKDDND